jgi:Peptidase family M23
MSVKDVICAGQTLLAACVIALLAPGSAAAVSPLRAHVLAPPSPVLGTDKARHLVYEVLLENTTAHAVTIDRLVVREPGRHRRIASFGPAYLAGHMLVLEVGASTTIAAGGTGFAFVDVALRARGAVPKALRNGFALVGHRRLVGAAATRVDRRPPVVLAPPLHGANLFVADGCCSGGEHAHGLIPVGDDWVNAQRYAIDWLRLDDGFESTFAGDPGRNESYLIYGDEIVAAAAGTIVATHDGVAENVPQTDPVDLPFEDQAGNFVVEDLGAGRFALYAHMQPGSVRVRVGDRVRTGQVLGLVGNSGGSSEPHLHFQVMDSAGAPNGVVANGLPFVFDSFRYQAFVPDLADPVIVPAPPPPHRRFQLPLAGDIQDFGH